MDLIAFTVVFLVVAVVLPTLRLKWQTGKSGYVADRAPSSLHRVAVEGFRGAAVALLAWPLLLRALGPGALSIWEAPAALGAIGSACAWSALLWVVVAQANMGRSWRIGIDAANPTPLVTGGLFAVVRNPIFTGILLMVLGVVLVTPSPWTLMSWVFLVFVLSVQVRLEEDHLLRQHGSHYREYAARVGRFLPALGRLVA